MDTLPEEVLELIAQHLSPLDMTRCSAVSRSWYEVFNLDRLWKRHCDVDLEEPLQAIPSVATPSFELSAAEDSTLPPTSYWKMVYFREKHLWKSWRTTEITHQLEEENIIKCDNKNPLDVDFLTDILVVARYSHHIEILDVSVKPAVIAAKTDIGEEIYTYDRWWVAGTNMLIVEKSYSILVFEVDISNKSIKQKYNFLFKHEFQPEISLFCRKGCLAKENLYIYMEDGSRLKILDLNSGKLVKDEPCPVKTSQNVKVSLVHIESSPTSDFVAVVFQLYNNEQIFEKKLFIYSLNQLTFLSNSQITLTSTFTKVSLDGNWIAVHDRFLNIFNISPTGKVILSDKVNIPNLAEIRVYRGSFLCMSREGGTSKIAIYFPSIKTQEVICCQPRPCEFNIINNKVVAVFVHEPSFGHPFYTNSLSSAIWKLSGQNVEKCDYFVFRHCKINRSFTKMINRQNRPLFSNCWYISHMW